MKEHDQTERDQQARDIFLRAVEMPSPEAQAAYVEGACQQDPSLRARVEALLQNHHKDSFLEIPALNEPSTVISPTPATEGPGTVIGRYKLLEKLGEGGFGAVYVAEQREPVKRRVALKIIKLGMDTKQVVARFEAERQALALMDHPNIAKVLDAGATEAGRPYFVMELVRGIPITKYCDENSLPPQERLDLFIKVCHAIQHAHQKGIIHRDIKPSNILVTLHDGVPVPKVIDFGIAKATQGELTDKTIYTQFQQFIGTPAYMSPEQAEMSGLDIDTRSDIYSLGVLLYELLVGKTPFDAKELLQSGLDEMRRRIREEEPVRPSTRVSTMADAERTSVAKHRQSDASKLIHLFRGDLDWIVMKCLEKDRTRRYDTANGLAMDLKRHLGHEPVIARPPSTTYRFQKAFRRNKLVFGAAAVVTLALVAGIWISLSQATRATRERNKAVEAESREAGQRKAAETAQTEAATQRDLAQDRLLDSLIREMRSISTIRPLGYRKELQDRVRQALDLPKAANRRDELRAEFAQALGDPLGAEPVEVMLTAPNDRVRLALSSDGELAAVWRWSQGLTIRETRTGKSVAGFENPGLPLPGLNAFTFNPVFSADSRALYGIIRVAEGIAPESFAVAEWRRNSEGSWAPRQRPPRPAFAVRGTREGVFVVHPVADETFQVLNLETGRSLGSFSPPRGEIRLARAAALAPKRGLIALGTSSGDGRLTTTVEVWSLTGPPRHVRLESISGIGRFHSARFSPDENYLACTCENGAVIYETTEFKVVSRHLGYMAEAYSGGAFVADGTTLAVPQGQRPGIRLISITSGDVMHLRTRELVGDLVSSEDGSTLAFQAGQTVSFVRLVDSRERRRLTGHVGGVPAVEFSPDGRLLASTGKDGSVRLWDTASGTLRQTVARPNAIGQTVSFSPDGGWLAVGDYQHDQIQILNVETGREVLSLGDGRPGNGQTWGCGFSPDGRRLAAVGVNGLKVWELVSAVERTNQIPWKISLVMEEQGYFRDLLFDPAGRWIAFRGISRSVGAPPMRQPQIFIRSFDQKISSGAFPADAPSVQSFSLLPGRNELVWTAAVDVQGAGADSGAKMLGTKDAPGESERTVHFLNPATLEITRSMPLLAPGERSSTYISNMRFSPDGSRLAAANHDGRRVNLYDVASGRRLYSLPDEISVIWWLAWHPDGRRLAVTRENGDISIWNLPDVEAAIAEAGLAP